VNLAFQPRLPSQFGTRPRPLPAPQTTLRPQALCAPCVSAFRDSSFSPRRTPLLRARTGNSATRFFSNPYFILLWIPGGGVKALAAFSQSPTTVAPITPLSATLTKKQGCPAQLIEACSFIAPRTTVPRLQLSKLNPPQAVNPIPDTLSPLSATVTKIRGRVPGAKDVVRGSLATDRESKMIRWHLASDCRGAARCAPPRHPSDLMATHVPILVVGAGISGLACAYYLRKSGIDAQIVEAAPRPGGVIRSERRDGFLLEFGPQSFSGTPVLRELCRDLSIEKELLEAPQGAPRFLLINGQLRSAPLSPPAFFASSLFSARTKWSIVRDLFGRSTPPADDESVAAFTRRKFSAELLDKLVGPFVSGIYAGDPEKLSLRAAFPQLHEAERTTGSVIRGMMRAAKSKPGPKQRPTLQSFRDGNETLIKTLAASLGPALRCGVEVTAIQRSGADTAQSDKAFVVETRIEAGTENITADRLVLATPTYVAAKLLRPELASPLGEIEYAPIALVSLGYRRADVGHSLEGFGFLIPRSEAVRTLGTVWNSSLFPGRAPQGSVLLTCFIGGATDPQVVALSSEEISAIVHREIAPILSIRTQPTLSSVQFYQRALPQYNLGHTTRIASLERESSSLLNLQLVGNYLRGPAIGACIEQALAVAGEIRAGVAAAGSR
jgi:protoporphyrinogen/coproporphyrinogen III oxidase